MPSTNRNQRREGDKKKEEELMSFGSDVFWMVELIQGTCLISRGGRRRSINRQRSFCRLISGRLLGQRADHVVCFPPENGVHVLSKRRPGGHQYQHNADTNVRPIRWERKRSSGRLLCRTLDDAIVRFPIFFFLCRSPNSAIAQPRKEAESGSRYHQLTMDDDGNKPTNTVWYVVRSSLFSFFLFFCSH